MGAKIHGPRAEYHLIVQRSPAVQIHDDWGMAVHGYLSTSSAGTFGSYPLA